MDNRQLVCLMAAVLRSGDRSLTLEHALAIATNILGTATDSCGECGRWRWEHYHDIGHEFRRLYESDAVQQTD